MIDIKNIKLSHGTRTEAAKRLNISRQTFNHRLGNYDLEALKMVQKVETSKILKNKKMAERAKLILESLSQLIA